jgi:predicted RNA-binding protein YlxR (DUF448 family)
VLNLKKKEPMRMCVACRQMNPKKSMIRIVRTGEREVSADPTGKMPGKGAYICKDSECLAKARKTGSLKRALDAEIPVSVYEELQKYAN